LDAIRRAVVAEHVVPVAEREPPRPQGMWARAWVELFWEGRLAWSGVTALWVVILGLNLGSRPGDVGPAAAAGSGGSVVELRLVLLEQVRLRQELLGEAALLPATPAAVPASGPRSERGSTGRVM
jgi:hypothetical protein